MNTWTDEQLMAYTDNALPLPHGVPIEVSSGTGPNWLAAH